MPCPLWSSENAREQSGASLETQPLTLRLARLLLYPVTCVIMQKNGAGLHTASSAWWDNSTDGACDISPLERGKELRVNVQC